MLELPCPPSCQSILARSERIRSVYKSCVQRTFKTERDTLGFCNGPNTTSFHRTIYKKRKSRRKKDTNLDRKWNFKSDICDLCDVETEQKTVYNNLLKLHETHYDVSSVYPSNLVYRYQRKHGKSQRSRDLIKCLLFFKEPFNICDCIEFYYPRDSNRNLIKYLLHFKSHVRLGQ